MLWNLVIKEIREMLTLSTMATILIVTVIFAAMGGLVNLTKGETTKKPVIAVLNLEKPEAALAKTAVSTLREHCEILYEGRDDSEALRRLRAHARGVALVEIPEGFDARLENSQKVKIGVTWIMRGAGTLDTISSAVMERHFTAMERAVSRELVRRRSAGLDEKTAANVVQPIERVENTFFKEKLIPMLSPARIAQVLAAQSITVPIVMMIILMLGGSVVVSSMGLEKENKTLETLLTLPVDRRTLVLGKLLGSAVVGLIMAAVFAVGFRYYLQNFEAPAESLVALGLDLGPGDYLLVVISLFASLLFGLAFSLLLGVLARDYKSAQMLTYALLVLAIFPMMVVMLKDFDTVPKALQIVLFAIPFSHPMMAMRQLALENTAFVLWGILYGLLASAALTAMVVRVFRSEILITGFARRARQNHD